MGWLKHTPWDGIYGKEDKFILVRPGPKHTPHTSQDRDPWVSDIYPWDQKGWSLDHMKLKPWVGTRNRIRGADMLRWVRPVHS